MKNIHASEGVGRPKDKTALSRISGGPAQRPSIEAVNHFMDAF